MNSYLPARTFLLMASSVTLHPVLLPQSGARPAGHVPQHPKAGDDGRVASSSAGGQPGQDDQLGEHGDVAGLLCLQQVHIAGHLSSVVMVLEVGDQAVHALATQDSGWRSA